MQHRCGTTRQPLETSSGNQLQGQDLLRPAFPKAITQPNWSEGDTRYPQIPKLTDDLAASWFLELWTIAPTPAKARQLRKSTVEQLLKQHRIRRVDTETVLRILREPAIKVAAGVAEAASVHIRSLIARLRVVNHELQAAERQLDKICTAIGETEAVSGDCLQRQTAFNDRTS